jgi:hypothetical protein
MTTDTAPLGGIPTIGTPVATLSLVGRQRPVKIVEHPAFRGRPRHEHPHAGFPPAFLALPVRVVSLNDPMPRPGPAVVAASAARPAATSPCTMATAA